MSCQKSSPSSKITQLNKGVLGNLSFQVRLLLTALYSLLVTCYSILGTPFPHHSQKQSFHFHLSSTNPNLIFPTNPKLLCVDDHSDYLSLPKPQHIRDW